jgi:hypothetical protein
MLNLTLRDRALFHGGIEDPESKHYTYGLDTLAFGRNVIRDLGGELPVIESIEHRPCRLIDRAQKLIVEIPWHETDEKLAGWHRDKKVWKRAVYVLTDQRPSEQQLADIDNLLRYKARRVGGVKVGEGWAVLDCDGRWLNGYDNHIISCVLLAKGIRDPKVTMGHAIHAPWDMVNLPFQGEYPGGRQWNLNAPQFTYSPQTGPCPHWDLVLNHCGRGLDEALLSHPWAMAAGINTGAAYLGLWAARMLREPMQPLPYLFLYSEKQNNGKSILHEGLSLLMTKGAVSADRALTNSSDFNGELAGAVLAYIEEKDISRFPGAYARIKNWVTSPMLAVRRMRTDQYEVPNTLHFIQTSNEIAACPVFPGDSRITMIHVPDLEREIPKPVLLDRLRIEAPQFMHRLLNLELPAPMGRLGIPPIDTKLKERCMEETVPEFVRSIADYMADKATAELTAGEFDAALGDGDWPKSIRTARKLIEQFGSYLRSRGIKAEFAERTAKGRPVILRRF